MCVESVASSKPKLSKADAISKAEKAFDAKYNDWKIPLEYFTKDDGHVALTYIVQVQNEDHWWEVSVDAANGEIVNAVDFVAEASVRLPTTYRRFFTDKMCSWSTVPGCQIRQTGPH